MANAEFRAAPPEFLGAACVKETERAHQDGVARDVTTDPMAEVRAELIFRSLLLRRMLDLAGSDFAGPDDDELLVEATTAFCAAADDYERRADRVVRDALGPVGAAARRWGAR